VKYVTKVSHAIYTYLNTNELTLEKSLTNVNYVINALQEMGIFGNMYSSILERSLTSVKYAPETLLQVVR